MPNDELKQEYLEAAVILCTHQHYEAASALRELAELIGCIGHPLSKLWKPDYDPTLSINAPATTLEEYKKRATNAADINSIEELKDLMYPGEVLVYPVSAMTEEDKQTIINAKTAWGRLPKIPYEDKPIYQIVEERRVERANEELAMAAEQMRDY